MALAIGARRDVREATVRAPERVIRAQVGRLPLVMADPDRLRQVLDNLLENAIRYAPLGPISVRASSRGAVILIEVSDRGPGIPPSERARIFEPFYRGEHGETSRRRGGGLGLAIAKCLVERHGGRSARSRRGAAAPSGSPFPPPRPRPPIRTASPFPNGPR